MCVCWGGGGGRGAAEEERGIINTRNSKHYDIRLSIYNDGMGLVEVERRLVHLFSE